MRARRRVQRQMDGAASRRSRRARTHSKRIFAVIASAAMQRSIIVGCALGFATVAHAQVLPFNEMGVTMGHHHLMVADVDAQRKIWVEALGGAIIHPGERWSICRDSEGSPFALAAPA